VKVRGFHQGQGYQSVTPAEGRIYVSNRFSARESLAPRLGPYMPQLVVAGLDHRCTWRSLVARARHPRTVHCAEYPQAIIWISAATGTATLRLSNAIGGLGGQLRYQAYFNAALANESYGTSCALC
jgi:hypothetical protein